MELNLTFLSGLGCGLCLGLSLFALKKYTGLFSDTAKSVKKVRFNIILLISVVFVSHNEKIILISRSLYPTPNIN